MSTRCNITQFLRILPLAAGLLLAGVTGCPNEPATAGPGTGSPNLAGPPLGPGSGAVVQPVQVPPPVASTSPQIAVAQSFKFSKVEVAPTQPDRGPGQQPLQQVKRESPMSLTASDGTGLRLISLKASGVVEEPLAFTELHLAFQNPQPRTIEGNFKITLPQGATVSRFAMRLGDRWQEGEVVERQAARQAYEDFLHRRQDPALLEQQGGNEFSARVFPIPGGSVKELILSYSQELVRDDHPYRIPLLGLPNLDRLEVRVLLTKGEAQGQGGTSLGGSLQTHQVVEVTKQNWIPDRDFEVAQAHTADRLGLRHENLVVARITPLLQTEPEEIPALFFLIDTSASRALGFEKQVEQIAQLIAGLRDGAGAATPIGVACFDQEVAPIFNGKAGDFGNEQVRLIVERTALGASNLHMALTWLQGHLNKEGQRFPRVLLVTDGVATAGEVEGDKLRTAVQGLAGAKVQRLDVLAVGGIRDDALLGRLVTAGLPRDGALIDSAQPLAEIGRRLTQATRSGIQVAVDGAQWVWPTVLNGVQAGDQVLVYADLAAGSPFALSLNGVPVAADRRHLAQVERPLLERAWIKGRISRIEHQRDTTAANDPDLREALRKQVIDLSVKYRVLSSYTALLVLETEQDYQRFRIDRNALADILTVGPTGITVLNRSAAAVVQQQPVAVTTTGAFKPPAPTGPAREGEQEVRRLMRREAAKAVSRGDRDDEAAAAASPGPVAASPASPRPESRPRPMATMARPSNEVDALYSSLEAEKKEEAKGDTRARFAAPPPPAAARPARLADEGGASSGRSMGGLGLRGGGEGGGGATAALADPAPQAEPTAVAQAPMPAEAPVVATPSASAPADRLVERPAGGQDRSRDQLQAEVESRTVLRLITPSSPPPAQPLQLATAPAKPAGVDPYTGTFKEVMGLLQKGDRKAALSRAIVWLREAPGDVMALIALGEALEALNEPAAAARAYGSLIDLFPSRADMRRFAGERLERLKAGQGLALATDTYKKAVEQRPDHPASHRLYAFALLKNGRPQEAVQALLAGVRRSYPSGRFAGVDRILREDLALAVAAWLKAAPEQRDAALAMLREVGAAPEEQPSLRFVLNWETDANDVDFHIHDGRGGHAYYQAMQLPSGGNLYADVTTGYGPECFTIRAPAKQRAYPYRLQAHYYSRGPMGYGMGKLQIIEHDGQGGLKFEERPFVVMQDQAFVEMGSVKGPLP